ncbi:PTS sugar transporter subunit IIA [Lacticaseibacillus jixianensis]|uniref:Ascorbate-specific PTS system EIIA component n=1 Tax=Lacticaseibacillus jixianensis TaxID=2486012 RepID=A0ABW4B9L3_9LACO|nr:PTS sugar transporter subunit IIA [Lacticaseibacillus jixianensis]
MKGTSLIAKDDIQVVDSVTDWKNAVRLASKPLLKDHTITKEYVDNMIQSVEDNGPYMVIADYFALMHARPGEGVNNLGMSLLTTKRAFDLEGKPVKIVLVLAATDNKSHLASLQKVMSVFMDDAAYQTVLNGSREEIVNLFEGLE